MASLTKGNLRTIAIVSQSGTRSERRRTCSSSFTKKKKVNCWCRINSKYISPIYLRPLVSRCLDPSNAKYFATVVQNYESVDNAENVSFRAENTVTNLYIRKGTKVWHFEISVQHCLKFTSHKTLYYFRLLNVSFIKYKKYQTRTYWAYSS